FNVKSPIRGTFYRPTRRENKAFIARPARPPMLRRMPLWRDVERAFSFCPSRIEARSSLQPRSRRVGQLPLLRSDAGLLQTRQHRRELALQHRKVVALPHDVLVRLGEDQIAT